MNTTRDIVDLGEFTFACGESIPNLTLAYETYGEFTGDNAILVCHALTGDQFVTGLNPVTIKDGWWSYAVGPTKSIDTNKAEKGLVNSFNCSVSCAWHPKAPHFVNT